MHVGWPADLSWYKLLTDWGSLIGGGIALAAGVLAYVAGVKQARATRAVSVMQQAATEQREARDLDALRKALAIELRQRIAQAFGAHNSLCRFVERMTPDSPVTARMVQASCFFPEAVIYPSTAHRIGLLGGSDATDVVIAYNLIEIGRAGAADLINSRTPDNLDLFRVLAVAEAFLQACDYAHVVLPKFRTGVPMHDSKDEELITKVGEAKRKWQERFPLGLIQHARQSLRNVD